MKNLFLLACLLAVIALLGCVQPECGNKICEGNESQETCHADCPGQGFESFSFAVYGDSRGMGNVGNEADYAVHRKLASLIEAKSPEFVLHTGDLVYNGCKAEQWENFLEIAGGICRSRDGSKRCDSSPVYLDSSFFPAIGNHENISSCPEQFFSVFPFLRMVWEGQRYYSFSHENAFFIVLDSSSPMEISGAGGRQLNWLRSQLQLAKGHDFVFVFFHNPLFSQCLSHGDDETVKRHWLPLFKGRVDAVFTGHCHLFSRTLVEGTHYVTTGGGGAALHEAKAGLGFSGKVEKVHHFVLATVGKDRLLFEVFDQNNSLVDSWEETKKQAG